MDKLELFINRASDRRREREPEGGREQKESEPSMF